ncbi:MAG: polymer-forming cytoskeletal protein [Gammaproteobacteria bacterium]|nr:polymer-forming cytoskeletal protein [Gammaproteobacteria bacterium]
MWKKPFNEQRAVESTPAPTQREESKSTQALIGPSITITGGLSGEEDVIIQGHVEGTVNFKKHSVTVGTHGRIKADIFAKEICVEGKLDGDLHGETRVIIRESGQVSGNILAPRVVMEDGCRFRGSVEMDPSNAASSSNEHKKTMSNLPPMAREVLKQQSTPEMEEKKVMNKN